MEHTITAPGPFAEIEEQVIQVLEQQGFVVRRTFSLHSAAGRDAHPLEKPGFSVLMLYAAEATCPPLGLITLYEREDQIVIQTASATQPPPVSDAEAKLVAALMMGGLKLCSCGGRPCRTATLERLEREEDV
ncbi:MAG TPA: hypothetical protein ENJ31_07760 [Anaerolineae bacterium]|nr:hypothetical protein [Anaerolineae bacterium]